MKNLFTIIVASLLLGTTSMAASDARIVVCNVMGQVVANTVATEIPTAGWQPGLYIARQGNSVVKFVVK